MAVIDTSIDMPKSCDVCPKRWKCELDILVKSYFPYNVVKNEYNSKRHEDCPLKPLNEMIVEIENCSETYVVGWDGQRSKTAKEMKQDILEIIHKYCDKEKTHD